MNKIPKIRTVRKKTDRQIRQMTPHPTQGQRKTQVQKTVEESEKSLKCRSEETEAAEKNRKMGKQLNSS